jgi:hypothetical protein
LDSLSGLGRPVVRRHAWPVPTDVVDVAGVASVEVTSEQELYPIDHLFDGLIGPGGSCWVASSAGPQLVTLRFHAPRHIGDVVVESEERWESRTQRIDVAAYRAPPAPGTAPAVEGASQLFEYAPYRESFHRATWTIAAEGITELHVRVTPVPADRRASLTAIILREKDDPRGKDDR